MAGWAVLPGDRRAEVSSSAGAKKLILLTQDASTVVQAAAADAISARAQQASGQIDGLLGVLNSPARRLGNNRTNCILSVLAKLAPMAKPGQKTPLLEVAVKGFCAVEVEFNKPIVGSQY